MNLNRNSTRNAVSTRHAAPIRTAIEGLENRQLLTTIKGTDIRILGNSDGTKDNGNDIVVKFDKAISTVDYTKVRMFGYSNNTILGGQVKTTIHVLSGTVSGSTVVLRTDVQVRKGASLSLEAGAVTDTSHAGVVGIIRTTKGLNRDRFTLALRSFKPKDKSLFSSAILPGGATAVTANTTPSANTVGPLLQTFLNKKVAAKLITQALADSTFARFSDAAVVAKVPAANLRAAILSLVGTIGEPAIAFYLDKKNSTSKDFAEIDFDGANFSSGAKINETSYTNTGKLKQVWNPNFAGESFVVLSGLIAHETAHEGRETNGSGGVSQINSQQEEVIANTIEDMIYAQQVVVDYTYSRPKTTLTLRANYRLLELLNSGDRQFPRVGVMNAPLLKSGVVNPGFTATDYDNRSTSAGKPGFKSFTADVEQEFTFRNVDKKVATATYPTVRIILNKMTGNTYTSSTAFGDALIADIDIGQDTISDSFAMKAARVIQVSAT